MILLDVYESKMLEFTPIIYLGQNLAELGSGNDLVTRVFFVDLEGNVLTRLFNHYLDQELVNCWLESNFVMT